MRAPIPTRLFIALGALALAACEPKSPSPSRAVGCTAEEMQSRQARTPACAKQFKALLDKAEAERRRGSAIADPPRAPARERF